MFTTVTMVTTVATGAATEVAGATGAAIAVTIPPAFTAFTAFTAFMGVGTTAISARTTIPVRLARAVMAGSRVRVRRGVWAAALGAGTTIAVHLGAVLIAMRAGEARAAAESTRTAISLGHAATFMAAAGTGATAKGAGAKGSWATLAGPALRAGALRTGAKALTSTKTGPATPGRLAAEAGPPKGLWAAKRVLTGAAPAAVHVTSALMTITAATAAEGHGLWAAVALVIAPSTRPAMALGLRAGPSAFMVTLPSATAFAVPVAALRAGPSTFMVTLPGATAFAVPVTALSAGPSAL